MATEGRVSGGKGAGRLFNVSGGVRCLGMAMAAAMAVAGAGCGAPMTTGPGQGPDVRGAASLRRNQPQVLMAGPGWLLHVNNERRGGLHGLVVYRVAKRQG